MFTSDDVDAGHDPGPRHDLPDDDRRHQRHHRPQQHQRAAAQPRAHSLVPAHLYDVQI